MNKLPQLFASLKVKNYRLYFCGHVFSLIGAWMQRTALGWYVYRLTNSAFLLGLISFLSMIPAIIISPMAGAWGDMVKRKNIVILTQALLMLQALVMFLLAFTGYINVQRIWPLVALGLMQGFIEAVDVPIRQSFLIDLVEDRKLLPNAIATNSAMVNIAKLIGPSLAGALILIADESWCFGVSAVGRIVVISMLLSMRISYHVHKDARSQIWHKIKDGISYAYGSLPIRFLISNLFIFTLWGMSYTTMVPIFARDILHGNAGTQGLLLSINGIGSLASSFILASRKSIKGLPQLMLIFGAGAALMLIVFSRSAYFMLSMVTMLLLGLGMNMQMVGTNTLLQSIVLDEMRSRILSVYSLTFKLGLPFGVLIAGSLTEVLGAPNTLSLCGVVCIGWVAFRLIKLPSTSKHILRMLVSNGNQASYRPVMNMEQA